MRSGLTRGIVYGLLFSLPVWVGILWAIHAYAGETSPQHKLAGWVHMAGCPHTAKAIGQNMVVLWFDDGESVQIDLNKTSDEKKEDLKAFIGAVEGYTFVAKCEMAT